MTNDEEICPFNEKVDSFQDVLAKEMFEEYQSQYCCVI